MREGQCGAVRAVTDGGSHTLPGASCRRVGGRLMLADLPFREETELFEINLSLMLRSSNVFQAPSEAKPVRGLGAHGRTPGSQFCSPLFKPACAGHTLKKRIINEKDLPFGDSP